MAQTKSDRYKYIIRKKLRSGIYGLRPSSIIGRVNGPRVLNNSIPKAGTNLVESLLFQFPELHTRAERTLRGWNDINVATLDRVLGIEKGEFCNGHLPAHPQLLNHPSGTDIKVLVMVRDPRDIAVSYVKYVTNIDTTHPAHPYMNSLKDDSARLLSVIEGVEGVVSPINDVLEKFSGWLNYSGALVIRFEDLVGPRGGSTEKRQKRLVEDIMTFLGIKFDQHRSQDICDRLSSTRSLTLRAPRLGNWKNHFEDMHVKALRDRAGHLLKLYDYDEW